MATKLNTTTSIVDFLKSKGQDSSFTARKKLFTEQGLNSRLGDFSGSAEQNRALLSSLSKPATAETPATTSGAQDALAVGQARTPSGAIVDTATGQLITPPPGQQQQASQAVSAIGGQPAAASPDLGTFDLTDIPTPPPITADQILARARGETNIQIAEQEKAIGKQRIDTATTQGIQAVRNDMASRGLFFSGARTVEEQAVRDEAVAKKLDIDIGFAKILGNAIDRAATELGKEIEDVINDAKDQRQQEVDFLRSIGLAVDPRSGQMFQTLEATRLQMQQQQQQFQNALAVANFEMAQQSFNLDLIKLDQDMSIAQQKSELDLARFGLEERRVEVAEGQLGLSFQKFEEERNKAGGLLPGASITPDQLSPVAFSVYSGTLSLKDITPTMRSQIGPELTAVGWTSVVSAEDRQTVATITSGLQEVLAAWDAVPASKKGIIRGSISQSTIGRTQDEDIIAFEAKKRIVGQQLARLFETGRLSDEDRKFYQGLMPNLLMDERDVAQASANSLTSQLEAQLIDQISGLSSGGIIGGSPQVVKSGGMEFQDNGDGTMTRIK